MKLFFLLITPDSNKSSSENSFFNVLIIIEGSLGEKPRLYCFIISNLIPLDKT